MLHATYMGELKKIWACNFLYNNIPFQFKNILDDDIYYKVGEVIGIFLKVENYNLE